MLGVENSRCSSRRRLPNNEGSRREKESERDSRVVVEVESRENGVEETSERGDDQLKFWGSRGNMEFQ